ncbi:MAG: YgiQ family radical SAM protein [Chloroflexi bacterium]|nr:YgiQ family radical SAM protein [Chloroflexota bacterium]
MYLPTTRDELTALGWDRLDAVLVTGDTYIDSSFIGAAVIGKILTQAGYRVGIIAQPDVHSPADIRRLGEPRLFWGVTAGSIDSMVANYTASKKRRRFDDLTPGGANDRRPDRAAIVYTNLIKRYFKNTVPIVLGGIEASLRRIAHYDFWDDRIRRSVLFDAKADVLVYGMAEKSVVELARAMEAGRPWGCVRGICYISSSPPEGFVELPSYEAVISDKREFIRMFDAFYANSDPVVARGLYQLHDTRYLVQNPPAEYLTGSALDAVYGLDYERDVHPYYAQEGEVKALETIRWSLITHQGCYGECNFCSIAVHQGRMVRWRSERSILDEAVRMAADPAFGGYILDVGGPTANMYGIECGRKLRSGSCADRRCLYPEVCPSLRPDHAKQISLLRKLRRIPGVKGVFVASGVRYDLVQADARSGRKYLRELVKHHVSGQMKVAPEHVVRDVLKRMGKPNADTLIRFRDAFYEESRAAGKEQHLTYYLIAAHPGCTERDMRDLKRYVSRELRINPEQVQIFTPTPSTYSSVMYYTGVDPTTGESVFVERDAHRREKQKDIVVSG